MRPLCCLFIVLVFLSCSTDKLDEAGTLQTLIGSKEIVLDNVIACAASNNDDELVSVFLYPRIGAKNIQLFEATSNLNDKNDFSQYSLVHFPLLDVFNGYLKKFEVEIDEEKWVIVSFEENGKIHLSNPIRLKQNTKPTEYLPQNVTVNAESVMPMFSWKDGSYDDTKIYFQVVSDVQNNLLSGTYTFEKMFTYYELGNVVLNITKNAPPSLAVESQYQFTLMGVSEDNWVNQFSIIDFELN